MRGCEHDLESTTILRPAPVRVETDGGRAHAARAVRARRRTSWPVPSRERLHDAGHGAAGNQVVLRWALTYTVGSDITDTVGSDITYTVGSDLAFQCGRYAPGSRAGRLTLAHELTHVVQQRSGPVDGTPAPGGVRISDPGDRFERGAVANAECAMAAPPVQVPPSIHRPGAGQVAGAAPAQRLEIQREESAGDEPEEEEAPVQQVRADIPVLQREGGDETEDEA